jgi:ATP-binding cassette subfamily B protein
MAAGEYRSARELHNRRKPEMGKNAERFYYKEEVIFEKPLDWSQIGRMGAFLLPYIRLIMVALVMMFLFTVTRLTVPWLIAQAIDLVLSDSAKPTFLTGWLFQYDRVTRLNWLVGITVCVHIVNWVTNYTRIRLTNYVGRLGSHVRWQSAAVGRRTGQGPARRRPYRSRGASP